jgi:Peptidase family S41
MFLNKVIFLYLIFLIPSFVFAQKKVSKSDFQKELQYTKAQIEKYHLGKYHYQTKENFEHIFKKTNENLPDSLSLNEAFQRSTTLVSSIKDLHSSVSLYKPGKNTKYFPFYVRKFNSDFYIHYNVSKDSTLMRGMQIISINGVKMIDIFLQLRTLYGADNNNQVSQNYYAERSFMRYYRLISEPQDSLLVEFKAISPDSVFIKKIATATNDDINKTLIKRYKNSTRPNMKFSVLDSVQKIGFLDVSSFTLKGNKFDIFQFKFKKELRKKFKEIRKKGIEHLVIDFRANGGGLVQNIARITRYVAKEPFNLEDSIIMYKQTLRMKYPWYSIGPAIFSKFYFKNLDSNRVVHLSSQKRMYKPVKNNHYKGKIYVLMDGGSYSATAFTIGLWRDMNLATFVGTAPGGANWGSFAGQWKNLKLKKSGLGVRVPLYKIVHAQKNKVTSSFTVQPDYFVNTSFEDFKKRKDSQVSFVLDLIRNSPK